MRELVQQIAQLCAHYDANLEADMRSAHCVLDQDASEALAGLSQDTLDALQADALAAGRSGYLLSIARIQALQIARFANNGATRVLVQRLLQSLASECSPGGFDNGPICCEILRHRLRLAELAGFRSAQAMMLAGQQLSTPEQLSRFLTTLTTHIRPALASDLHLLQQFAESHGLFSSSEQRVAATDIAFLTQRYRDHVLGLPAGTLQNHFELADVIAGLGRLTQSLFGIRWEQGNHAGLQHASVLYFKLIDSEGHRIAGLYLDLLARPGKSPGACSDRCSAPIADGSLRCAVLCCNFSQHVDQRVYLQHSELQTLLHELGHCLQLTLGDCPDDSVALDVTFSDCTEYASSWLERFAYSHFGLSLLLGSSEEASPKLEAQIAALLTSQRCLGSFAIARQLELAWYDFVLHSQQRPLSVSQLQRIFADIQAELGLPTTPVWLRSAQSFRHIFSGGYGGRYYGYLYSQIRSTAAVAALSLESPRALSTAEQRAARQSLLQPDLAPDDLTAFLSNAGIL